MKKLSIYLTICALFITGLVVAIEKKSYSEELEQLTLPGLSTSKMQNVIEDGVSWFKEAQEANGHFKYEYEPFLDRYIDDDNMVRQAGALYILGEIFRNDPWDKMELEENIVSAISYFKYRSKDNSYGERDFKCLKKTSSVCTLGGTSLLLLGILDAVEGNPDLEDDYAELIEEYKEFLMAMKLDGAGFINDYYLKKDQTKKESSFGNGEAFLALTRYYLYNPDEEVKAVIDESFQYFKKEYGEDFDNNFYLWGMAAIKSLYALDPREEYFKFVKDYTDWRVDAYKTRRASTHNKCAYIEGVVSAYSVLEPNIEEEEKEYYLEEIDFWLSHSEELQVDSTDSLRIRYNNNNTKRLRLPDKDKAVGGFLTDTDEPVQRIDFTQHCLSSFLQKLVDIDGHRL